ncbi:hypothetical protein QQX98_012754 [Neonectria punicea]|uniref:Uncharacterized protein n=1 Tax=Neonectria punicea TaxID=979145 RepID=A0ABR1GIA8_9HYPO
MAVRGFFTSVRAATARVLININVSYSAFYQEGPLEQFILRFGDQKGLFKLEAFLKRLRIRTTYLKEKKNKKGPVWNNRLTQRHNRPRPSSPSPKVVYKESKQAEITAGGWNMVPRGSPSLKFNTAGSLKKWSCLYVEMPDMYPSARTLTPAALNELLGRFTAVLNNTGITASAPLAPKKVLLNDTDDPQLEQFLALAALSLQLLFVILPAAPVLLYYRIKQLGDYFRNKALKFNLKLGSNNQLVEPTRQGIVAGDKTIVISINVTHPSPSSSAFAPSIASMVASVDRWLGQWPAVLSIQPQRRQEMVSHLGEMLKSRLRLWMVKGTHDALHGPPTTSLF